MSESWQALYCKKDPLFQCNRYYIISEVNTILEFMTVLLGKPFLVSFFGEIMIPKISFVVKIHCRGELKEIWMVQQNRSLKKLYFTKREVYLTIHSWVLDASLSIHECICPMVGSSVSTIIIHNAIIHLYDEWLIPWKGLSSTNTISERLCTSV